MMAKNKRHLNLIQTEASNLPESDQSQFIEAVETEIQALHEGNFARYRASSSTSTFASFINGSKHR